MRALDVWKTTVGDKVDFLDELIPTLHEEAIDYCVIGGQGVNAYVDPLVSLDLHLVIATTDLPRLEETLNKRFKIERFPHSVNVSASGSDLRVQFQTDPRYADFLPRGKVKKVLGLDLRVAAVDDVLKGKVWAASDPARRPNKRRKDLLDIERLLESFPPLSEQVPEEILRKVSQPAFLPSGEAKYVKRPTGRAASRLARGGVLDSFIRHIVPAAATIESFVGLVWVAGVAEHDVAVEIEVRTVGRGAKGTGDEDAVEIEGDIAELCEKAAAQSGIVDPHPGSEAQGAPVNQATRGRPLAQGFAMASSPISAHANSSRRTFRTFAWSI